MPDPKTLATLDDDALDAMHAGIHTAPVGLPAELGGGFVDPRRGRDWSDHNSSDPGVWKAPAGIEAKT